MMMILNFEIFASTAGVYVPFAVTQAECSTDMAALSLKRRSAATEEAHRSRKRPAFDRGTVSYEANGKDKQTGKQILSTGQKAPAQRKLPVTSTKVDHSVITSEDEDEDEAHNEESADLDEDIEDDEMRDGGMVAEKDKLKNGMSTRAMIHLIL